MSRAKLFISHASEDKDDFVRPLAEELRKSFDVWYDEYSLIVGPSLLSQISKGMRECQYGVVVLSKAFFGKKWTRAELDGLFDLEPADQSLILPIWHGVDRDEVSQFSPVLASRVATRSELGVPRVVSDLQRSIEAGERTKVISDPLAIRIKAFQEAADAEQKYNSWARSNEGIEGAWGEWNSIAALAKEVLDRHNEKRFQVAGPRQRVAGRSQIEIQGPQFLLLEGRNTLERKLTLRFDIWGMAINSISDAQCRYRVLLEHVGPITGRADFTTEFYFNPYCTKDGSPVWQDLKRSTADTKQLVDLALMELFDTANKLQRGGPLTYNPVLD